MRRGLRRSMLSVKVAHEGVHEEMGEGEGRIIG